MITIDDEELIARIVSQQIHSPRGSTSWYVPSAIEGLQAIVHATRHTLQYLRIGLCAIVEIVEIHRDNGCRLVRSER